MSNALVRQHTLAFRDLSGLIWPFNFGHYGELRKQELFKLSERKTVQPGIPSGAQLVYPVTSYNRVTAVREHPTHALPCKEPQVRPVKNPCVLIWKISGNENVS